MDEREKRIREQHPDWTDEQVTAEVDRLKAADPPADPPSDPGPKPDNEAFARLRREKEAAERRARELEQHAAERERKEAEEQGRYKELAEQEKARADAAEAREQAGKQRRLAERTATDLKYRDTGYALYLLEQDKVDLSDAGAVKAALEQKAKDRPDLVGTAPPPPSGGPTGGTDDPPPALTREALEKMSPDQIAKLDPERVNAALAG